MGDTPPQGTGAVPGDAMSLTAAERLIVQALVLSDAIPFDGADIAAILADTTTIVWGDITGIINDIGVFPTANYADLATYVEDVRTRLVAIVADTGAIAWGDITGIINDIGVFPTANYATIAAYVEDIRTRLIAILADVTGLAGAVMRGTDNALLAASYTTPPTVGQIDTELTGTHGAGSWAGGAAFVPPTRQAEANQVRVFNQNTWYTVLDTSADVRVYMGTVLVPTGATFELKMTIDGQVITSSGVACGAGTTYYMYMKESDLTYSLTTTEPKAAFLLEGVSVKVEARDTSGNDNAEVRVIYGKG